MEFLHSSMDHPVSQRCRIYQLEEIRIKAGETVQTNSLNKSEDYLIDVTSPQMRRQERHIQFRMVRALSDVQT